MPEFRTYLDVDASEFVSECNKNEIKELIDALIENEHLPTYVKIKKTNNVGVLEGIFLENMDKLKEKYYRLSQEDEKTLESLFQKYV